MDMVQQALLSLPVLLLSLTIHEFSHGTDETVTGAKTFGEAGDVDGLMNVRFRGVLAPQNDQPGVSDIPRRVVFVVAQRESAGLEPRRPAQITIRCRASAVEAPEVHADGVQQPLRAAR